VRTALSERKNLVELNNQILAKFSSHMIKTKSCAFPCRISTDGGYYMKKSFALILALAAAAAMAQTERDYGNLLPVDHFSIKNSRVDMVDARKRGHDIIHSRQDTNGDEFIYKTKEVQTPKQNNPLRPTLPFKLNVERQDGKISRISSVSFTGNKESKDGEHMVQTASILPSGAVHPQTNCYETFRRGFMKVKENKDGFHCVTVNRDVCNYINKSNIDTALVTEINNCSAILTQLDKHQKALHDLSKDDFKKDLEAINKINGRLRSTDNFYEIDSKTLKNVSHLVTGYESAIGQCAFMEEEEYFSTEDSAPAKINKSKILNRAKNQ
jgi:hypothetical protein